MLGEESTVGQRPGQELRTEAAAAEGKNLRCGHSCPGSGQEKGAGPGDQSLFLVRTHLQSPCYRFNTRSEGKEKNQEEPQDVGPEQSEGQSYHLPSWTSLAGQVC